MFFLNIVVVIIYLFVENYFGYFINVFVGCWFKNKDIYWYNCDIFEDDIVKVV